MNYSQHTKLNNFWEMFKINGRGFAILMAKLPAYTEFLYRNLSKEIEAQTWQTIKSDVESSIEDLEKFDCELSALQAKQVCREIDALSSTSPPKNEIIWSSMRALLGRLHDELRNKVIYYIEPDTEKYISEGVNVFSVGVQLAFVNASDDLKEASICFGFERYTACVFHLMRATEQAVRDVGTKHNVAIIKAGNYKNWYDIEVALKDVVDANALIQLGRFRKHLRHDTMHPSGDHYLKDEVKKIFPAVQALLDQLAECMG